MNNRPWNLEAFLDSLIVELDRARETLAVKAINKPLTYAVKDVNLEMQLFPSFDGRKVQFVTAQPGQAGASKIAIQLGSITDQQIRKTTREPTTTDDISIDVIDEIDEDTKLTLQKFGVNSVSDLEEMQRKNVDLEKVSDKKLNYSKLAGLLQKARRGSLPPRVFGASLSLERGKTILILDGDNLGIDQDFQPVAVVNGRLADVAEASRERLAVDLTDGALHEGENELVMAVDPFTVFKVNIKGEMVS